MRRPPPLATLVCAVLVSAIISADSLSAQGVQGDLRILDLTSRIFGNERKLRVWLPPGYEDPINRERTYPVLYLNDGQNLFEIETVELGTGEWRVDETMSELLENHQIPPLIVVGIDNAGRRHRAREYLPYPDRFLTPPEPEPQGMRYGEFLASEVIPLVERLFRITRRREARALGGSSYGALIALHVAISRPDLVSRLLLESPSLYVDDEHALRQAASVDLELERVYLGVGTNELALKECAPHPANTEAVEGVEKLASILREQGLIERETLEVRIEPCAEHREAAWARRLPEALRFLFPES